MFSSNKICHTIEFIMGCNSRNKYFDKIQYTLIRVYILKCIYILYVKFNANISFQSQRILTNSIIFFFFQTGILRYKVDFQCMQLDELDNNGFDLDDY